MLDRMTRAGAMVLLAGLWAFASSAAAAPAGPAVTVTCDSKVGGRNHCPADTSAGVALIRSTGTAACLLGRTW